MKPSSSLIFHIFDHNIISITLNRPDIHNAFDDKLIQEFIIALDNIQNDKNIRAVIIAANGKNFCAGADLNWMQRIAKYSYEENLADAQQLATLMHKLNTLNKPTIALVQGGAFGGGVGLVACCDIALAAENASFCLSEVKIGLIPSVISPYVIAAIGEKAARRYFLTAEKFNAETAQQLGLIHAVVPEQKLAETGDKIIQQLLQNSPAAISAAKELIRDVASKNCDANLIAETAKRIAKIRVSQEGQEGLSAFLEKRNPSWAKK